MRVQSKAFIADVWQPQGASNCLEGHPQWVIWGEGVAVVRQEQERVSGNG